ncbi:hypothetical protein Msil_0173 [Methylocella silvestris BL2]|uniref:Uncharacterized protein n=1 Tax=Methylocella silvestris (strain DSM 15510 / CIP 108128 / LMG 27833 / NCIMB 13906 / BL2) TaxID=395965 RepID=B8EN19_METSB|nr:hypothetical protein Msil_0173 [Methylocella silvestris BL2]
MPDAYVIQIGGRTAGIVARDGRDCSFNFFAASQMFNAMEGQRFEDPAAAEKTARYLAKHGSLPRKPDVALVASAGPPDVVLTPPLNPEPNQPAPFRPEPFSPEPFTPAPWRRQARVV